MTFKLARASIYYGDRSVSFANIHEADGIPALIESADDLDLEAIAKDLERFVFQRCGRRNRPCTPVAAWNLEIGGTSAEQAKQLNEDLAASGYEGTPGFTPSITVTGNGIGFYWTEEVS